MLQQSNTSSLSIEVMDPSRFYTKNNTWFTYLACKFKRIGKSGKHSCRNHRQRKNTAKIRVWMIKFSKLRKLFEVIRRKQNTITYFSLFYLGLHGGCSFLPSFTRFAVTLTGNGELGNGIEERDGDWQEEKRARTAKVCGDIIAVCAPFLLSITLKAHRVRFWLSDVHALGPIIYICLFV